MNIYIYIHTYMNAYASHICMIYVYIAFRSFPYTLIYVCLHTHAQISKSVWLHAAQSEKKTN